MRECGLQSYGCGERQTCKCEYGNAMLNSKNEIFLIIDGLVTRLLVQKRGL